MAISLLFLLAGCSRQDVFKLEGATMGTRWHVSVRVDKQDQKGDIEAMQKLLQQRLDQLDAKFSTWKQDSELNQINRSPLNQAVSVSNEMLVLLLLAKEVWQQSEGAFDPTVGPLVDLWGFGPAIKLSLQPPTKDVLKEALARTGFDKLQINRDASSVVKLAAIELDFSAFAKGYAVDQLALLLDQQGFKHYLVEVGGELKLKGFKADEMPWKIAIEKPVAERGVVQKALLLTDSAVATSGDYRNFFEYQGKHYSHSINPLTGFPVEHELASVSVFHESAALADAWATALTVMGERRALERAQQLELAVLLLVRDNNGWQESGSAEFEILQKRFQ